MIQVTDVVQAGYKMVFCSLKESGYSHGPQGHKNILKCPKI